ncbi:MAG: glycoside hydrolase family 43 protein [Fimbriimonadaceae bacterium]
MSSLLIAIAAMITQHPQTSSNPIFSGWYADPEIHVFEGRYYVYPTYSAPYEKQTFYEAFSSPDLVHWHREGRILDFKDVPWSTNRAAWAPSVIERNGKYFMYFSAGDGAGIGVAVSDHPGGPFKDALGEPLIKENINGAQPIDAMAFLDDDDQAYLYYGGWKHANVVKLTEDMLHTEGDFKEITPEGYVEGSFMLKRKGEYVFMWSEGGWGNSTYGVAYARAKSPTGPFERIGKILGTDPTVAKGAGHHSVLQLPGTDEYVICYHRRPLEETDANARVVCLDRLVFDENGNILPVKQTFDGVKAHPLTKL